MIEIISTECGVRAPEVGEILDHRRGDGMRQFFRLPG
jgi:hypothetical protein